MTNVVQHSVGKPLQLGVERDGKLIHLTATPDSGQGIKVEGAHLANHGYLGFSIVSATKPVSALAARARPSPWWGTSIRSGRRSRPALLVPRAVVHLPPGDELEGRPDGGEQPGLGAAGRSPSSASPTSARRRSTSAWYSLLMFLIAINIVFAIFNMLPMIPLDGGHVAVAAYEWIRTKKGPALLPGRHHQAVARRGGLHRLPARLRRRRHLPRHHPSAADTALTVELSSSPPDTPPPDPPHHAGRRAHR